MNLKELLKQRVDDEDLLPDLPQENKDKNTEIIKAYKEGYEQGKKDAERRGRWIEIRNVAFPHLLCSECKKPFYGSYSDAWNYCPNCGARMEVE